MVSTVILGVSKPAITPPYQYFWFTEKVATSLLYLKCKIPPLSLLSKIVY